MGRGSGPADVGVLRTQVRKALPRGATDDLSLKTLGILTAGLAVWILYGALRGDWVIMLGDRVGATLSATVLACKIRGLRGVR